MTDTIPLSSPLPKLPTYIGRCCREWIMPAMGKRGKCGLCGEMPAYEREDQP
jgi:hypothetical protein